MRVPLIFSFFFFGWIAGPRPCMAKIVSKIHKIAQGLIMLRFMYDNLMFEKISLETVKRLLIFL